MFGFVFRSTHARTHETKIQILNFLAAREEKTWRLILFINDLYEFFSASV